jgi:Tfp pilus assembly protein PilX
MKNLQKGFTLFVSLVLASTLLLIATGVVNLALKQSLISSSGKESQLAYYAADTGMECALFWDVKNPDGEQSAFATSTTSTISCNKDAANPLNEWVVGGGEVSVVEYITFLPDPYCAKVTVTKNVDGTTLVESMGYNTCDPTNSRRVERAVRASY